MTSPLARLILAAVLMAVAKHPSMTYDTAPVLLNPSHAVASFANPVSASVKANNSVTSRADHAEAAEHGLPATRTDEPATTSDSDVGAMAMHMAWSDPRPLAPGDKQRAEDIVETLRKVLPQYEDYRVAERDGFHPFHPEVKQPIVHFTNYWYAFKNLFRFNPAEPTSLLYKPAADGGYVLVGAMYTAPRWASQTRLNDRVPLSIARWHRHINLCFPPKGKELKADWTRFGPKGSITTKAACDAAGGRFFPQLFGWMVHVYPFHHNSAKIWAH